MKLGSLVVEIGADTKSFIKGSDDTKRRLVQLGQQSRSTVNSLGKIAGAAAAAGTALAATIVVQAANAARELQNMSDIANTTPETFQKMAFAARRVGIEQEKLSDILKDFNDRVGDFNQTGAGPMADFFEKIAPKVGITADNFRNLSGPQAMQLYVDSLEQANLAQEDMVFYMEAMASDSTALLPLLRDGGRAMKEQADEAERLGLILSDVDTERLSQLSDKIDLGRDKFSAFTKQLGAELTPAITGIMEQLQEVTAEMGGVDDIARRVAETGIKGFGAFADVLRGVHVAGKTLQLGFQGVGTAILSITSMILEGWQRIFDQMISGVQGLIDTVNSIPGVPDIPTEGVVKLRQRTLEAAEAQVALRDTMHASIAQTKDELHELAMQPMPSDQFDEFLAKAREKSTEAAEVAVEARRKMAQETAIRSAGGGEDEDSLAQAELEKRLERIREANLTELELLREKQAMEAEILAQGRERGLEIKGGYDQAEREMEARHQKDINDITQRAAEERRRLEEEKLRQREATTGQILGNISTLMNTESRKMFEIGKAAGIANAVISTYQGAAKALELGWPLGPIAAAAITANGFAQVSAIRSQSFGGGGGASGSTTQAINDQTSQVETRAQQEEQRTTNLRVEGISRDSLFSGEQVMSTIEQLWKDGAGQGRVIFE